MSSSPELQANIELATEELYATFAPYRTLRPMEACRCCVSFKDHLQLLSKSIRDLTVSELDHYASNAITTWGTVADFKRFLPRLLELASFGRLDTYLLDIDRVAVTLAYANWSQWPREERGAISEWFDALWSTMIADYPSSILASDFLLAADELGLEPERFVRRMLDAGSLPAARHLAQAALSGVWWGSWKRKNIIRPKLYKALITPRTLDMIDTAFFDNADEESARLFAEAADLVCSELQR